MEGLTYFCNFKASEAVWGVLWESTDTVDDVADDLRRFQVGCGGNFYFWGGHAGGWGVCVVRCLRHQGENLRHRLMHLGILMIRYCLFVRGGLREVGRVPDALGNCAPGHGDG